MFYFCRICIFRVNPATDSNARRQPIPKETDLNIPSDKKTRFDAMLLINVIPAICHNDYGPPESPNCRQTALWPEQI